MNFEEWSEVGEAATGSDVSLPQKFRPARRPPMASLYIFDDGQETGETVRIRTDEVTIGRNANISIPHDEAIAACHIKIIRRKVGADYRWLIEDIEGSSGLFVRMRKATLNDGTTFLAGSDHYVFSDCPVHQSSKTELSARLAAGSIPGQSVFEGEVAYASIERLSDSKKIWLIAGEYWIGRDSKNALSSPHDSLLGAQHLLISKPSSRWMASSFGVTNGFWVKLHQLKVTKSCTFQIGEQRCRLNVGI